MTTRHVATRDERTSFSAALKAATWRDHEAAESSPFMDALLEGDVTREGYAALLAQQLYAYRIIEDAAATMADDPVAGGFVADELHRVPSLERDLAALLGGGWEERISPSAATEASCSARRRLKSASQRSYRSLRSTRASGGGAAVMASSSSTLRTAAPARIETSQVRARTAARSGPPDAQGLIAFAP